MQTENKKVFAVVLHWWVNSAAVVLPMKMEIILGWRHAWLIGVKAPSHSCLSPFCSSCTPSGIPVVVSAPALCRVCFVLWLYSILLTLFHWLSCPEWGMRRCFSVPKGTLALLSEENKACRFALLPPDAIPQHEKVAAFFVPSLKF